jgi:hypothetical protein
VQLAHSLILAVALAGPEALGQPSDGRNWPSGVHAEGEPIAAPAVQSAGQRASAAFSSWLEFRREG